MFSAWGGMGEVVLAERANEAYDRRVAIQVIQRLFSGKPPDVRSTPSENPADFLRLRCA